jgi:hypothetical protein
MKLKELWKAFGVSCIVMQWNILFQDSGLKATSATVAITLIVTCSMIQTQLDISIMCAGLYFH